MVQRQYGRPQHTDTNHQPGPSSPPTTTGLTRARLRLTYHYGTHHQLTGGAGDDDGGGGDGDGAGGDACDGGSGDDGGGNRDCDGNVNGDGGRY